MNEAKLFSKTVEHERSQSHRHNHIASDYLNPRRKLADIATMSRGSESCFIRSLEGAISKRKFALLSALVVGSCAITVATPTFAQTTVTECARMKALDPDNDGTMDLNEARKAASAPFDRLDRDKDGTLDQKELSGRLTRKELQAADPDHDGTMGVSRILCKRVLV
jgi:hypothetical protein